MAIQRIPSAWDYAAEGVSGFNKGREDKRKKALEEFHIINQLYQSGGATADQLAAAGKATGIPSLGAINPLPTQAERREKLLSQPATADIDMSIPGGTMMSNTKPLGPGMGTISGLPQRVTQPVSRPAQPKPSDTEYEAAGLSSPTEQTMRRTQLKIAQGNLTAQPKKDRLADQEDTDKHFKNVSERYVEGELPDIAMGELDENNSKAFFANLRNNRKAIVDSAYAKYKTTRQSSAMGQIPDEAYARSFFDAAFTREIAKKYDQYVTAKAAASRTLTTDERLFSELTQRLNNVKDRMRNLTTADQMLMFNLKNPAMRDDPSVKEMLGLLDMEKRLIEAQDKTAPAGVRGKIGPPKIDSVAAPEVASTNMSFEQKVSRVVSSLKDMTLDAANAAIDSKVGKGLSQDEAKEAKKRLEQLKIKADRAMKTLGEGRVY